MRKVPEARQDISCWKTAKTIPSTALSTVSGENNFFLRMISPHPNISLSVLGEDKSAFKHVPLLAGNEG